MERFKRWSVYTPAILVCLQPRLLTVVALHRFYQAGRHTAKKPPSVLSPFAQLRCYLRWGDVSAISSEGVTPPSSLLRAHVPLPLGSLLLRHLASFEESLQVVRSPCCPRELPDVISENLSLDAGSPTPAAYRVLSPVSSTVSSAFPTRELGRLSASVLRITTSRRGVFEAADIPLCSGLQVCSPPRSFLPLRILPQSSRGFYVRAYRALLPPHAPDMLTVRIQVIDGTGTFTLSDSQPCRLLLGRPGLRSILPWPAAHDSFLASDFDLSFIF